MDEPRWLSRRLVDAIHLDQLRQHGGSPGVRDANLIESALQRPLDKWHYGGERDLIALAAAYGYGLIKNHGYVDGNKRVGFICTYVFLGANGVELDAPEPEAVMTTLSVADGSATEQELAAWLRAHSRPQGAP
ncbi:MAG TPA: type II toxin-antitoxin system death-on-curing family toxin [Longimicrobiaceae bacterium]|nr:type II toxin-antitoxin system death-on-curing family toxin [Longimicrobiaceae bacterium]